MTWFQTIVLAIVEGISEFIPVSSTGHMIIASSIMGINEKAFTKLFEVCIQFGAILSVVVLYWKKFFAFSRWQFYCKLLVAFIPAVIMGVLFAKKIDALLESSLTVGIMLFLGGIILLFIDRLVKHSQIDDDKEMTYRSAFVIGWFVIRQSGSHMIMQHPTKKGQIVCPNHGSREMPLTNYILEDNAY